MDGSRFDSIARNVGEQTNRRNVMRTVAGSALAALGLGAVGRVALGQGVHTEAKGYRGDDCSHDAGICKKGLECDSDKLTCEYKHKCGNKFRGKKGDACNKNNDCCKDQNLTCDNNKCKRDEGNS